MLDLMSLERVDKGVQRLLMSPKDLTSSVRLQCPEHSSATGVAEHQELFEEYVEVLEIVGQTALAWFDEALESHVEAADDADAAVREYWLARPAGPAAFPGFVAFIRDYWLSCSEINGRLPEENRVAPEQLLVGWLLEGSHPNELKILSCMPYWPIGLDEEGNWV